MNQTEILNERGLTGNRVLGEKRKKKINRNDMLHINVSSSTFSFSLSWYYLKEKLVTHTHTRKNEVNIQKKREIYSIFSVS